MNINLSIITPCYNGENLIEVAIKSIINQNRKDIELIIIDDGSIDKTEQICKPYVSETIRYIRTENGGAGRARNVGLDNARGKWISFLDCDDVYLHRCIDDVFISNLMEYEKDKVDLIYTPRMKNDIELKGETEISFPESVEDVRNHMPLLEFVTCIYRREFLYKNELRFYEYRKQDIESAFRYLAFSNAKRVEINDSMAFYLQRDNLLSNTHTWNRYNLYEVKAKIFADLFRRTSKVEDKPFLIETCIESLKNYYKLSIKHGYFSKEVVDELRVLLNEVRGEYALMKGKRTSKVKLEVMRFTWSILKIRRIRQKKSIQAKPLIVDATEISNRLIAISGQVKDKIMQRRNVNENV